MDLGQCLKWVINFRSWNIHGIPKIGEQTFTDAKVVNPLSIWQNSSCMLNDSKNNEDNCYGYLYLNTLLIFLFFPVEKFNINIKTFLKWPLN